jgi:hypothetical protein
VLTDVQGALASARNVEVGVFADFNAGVSQIVSSGRHATDTELHALSQLASAIVPRDGAPVVPNPAYEEEEAGTGPGFAMEEGLSPAEASAAVSEAGGASTPAAQVTESAGEEETSPPAAAPATDTTENEPLDLTETHSDPFAGAGEDEAVVADESDGA